VQTRAVQSRTTSAVNVKKQLFSNNKNQSMSQSSTLVQRVNHPSKVQQLYAAATFHIVQQAASPNLDMTDTHAA
jgi:hypothetical protein